MISTSVVYQPAVTDATEARTDESQDHVMIVSMDPEKTMQFLLDMQAKHDANLAWLESVSKQHEERLARLETSLAKLEGSVATVTDLVGRLAQAEIRLVERMEALDARLSTRMEELARTQAQTDQRLNALIDIVGKLIRRNEPNR